MDKKEIIYPRGWSFRIIGTDKEKMLGDIALVMGERKHELKNGNKKGKYISLNLKLTVDSEEDRNALFTALKNSDSVTMIL